MEKWLKYWVFQGDKLRKRLPIRHIIIGYFNFTPRFNMKKKQLIRRYKNKERKPPAFIHIPKTGGSTLANLKKDFNFLSPSHCVVRKNKSDKYVPIGLVAINPNKLKDFFVFTTIRNPITLLVSYYYHALGKTSIGPINTNHYDFDNANKGFDYLVKSIINREDKWPSRKLLYLQMFNDDNICIVDWINRQETLNKDINRLNSYYNMSLNKKCLQKKVRNSKINDYLGHYTNELLEKVLFTYSREMRLFGYKINGFNQSEISLKPLNKNKLKYDYLNNNLFLNDSLYNRIKNDDLFGLTPFSGHTEKLNAIR